MDSQQYPNNDQQYPNNDQQAPQQPQYQPPQAPNYPQPPVYPQEPVQQPGKGLAVGALVCGILSLAFIFLALCTSFLLFFIGVPFALFALISGIVGVVLAVNAKKQGFVGGMNTAGLVMSCIGLALGALVFICCVGCIGCVGCAVSNGNLKGFDLQDIFSGLM